jgi:hypothetical protein
MVANFFGLQTTGKVSQGGSFGWVIVVAAQCTEGTSVSWAPYLLNLFMDE